MNYFADFLIKKLQENNEIATELVLEVIKFACDAGNQETLVDFLTAYLQALVEKDRRIPIAFTIDLLKLIGEINNQQVFELLTQYIGRVLERSEYIQSDLAFEILKFICKVAGQEVFDNFKIRYLADMLQAQKLVSVELAVEVIKLALEGEGYDRASIEGFYRKNITLERCYLGLLPIDTIVDLRELTREFGDEEMLGKINERLKL